VKIVFNSFDLHIHIILHKFHIHLKN